MNLVNNISYKEIKEIKLGAIYSKNETTFKVFAPNRDKIDLVITDDYKKVRRDIHPMKKDEMGIFTVSIKGDYDGYFYNYIVEDKYEVTDPYAVSASINSMYSAVINLDDTNPEGFKESKHPDIKENEAIICELSVKNYTADKSSGVYNRGKFLGLAEAGTRFKDVKTGLDNIEELGVTHVQVLPIYDFISVDEDHSRFFHDDNYNWGYDPELYFAPEGSYSTNPLDPKSRVREAKEMVKAFHDRGSGVIMDVVFNHTFKTIDSNLNTLAPKYYHRTNPDESFSNGSGCGNELASEKPFVRKLIIDSLVYWAKEYKIDGFRFDLMALIDLETIKIAIKELKKINPNIIIYGEPWMALSSPLAYDQQIWKGRQRSNGFGVFNDDFRDAIKGDVNSYGKGYIQGIFHNKHAIETGIRGSIDNGNGLGFADDASETINYFNCHDNLIIYDKLAISLDDTSDINSYIKLALGIIMLSFGKPFIYEGNEFNHSKKNDANSYRSPLYVNAIDWADKENNKEIFTYTKNLISLRKSIEAFKYTDYNEIEKRLKFIEGLDDSLIGYSLDKKYLVLINANGHEMFVGHDKLTNHLGIEKFNKIEKIFDKEGINNINIDISHGINLESLSVNVYKIGDAYGL
ncbi:type I pullulanase [Anaerococcus degeneri]|uniref:Type I pullulanase n=1 Tax=Anaerococcus degeneri TaxID=361500 RepID=A0ABS7Z1Q7_9FIRM|nr:type I pullulanase [Anaerococcus degeneri]MBP2014960.1 pullulanase [Anaerococcus degeneri]MCA2097168.1 type I pullulanase [Anaerococcus degeneri]